MLGDSSRQRPARTVGLVLRLHGPNSLQWEHVSGLMRRRRGPFHSPRGDYRNNDDGIHPALPRLTRSSAAHRRQQACADAAVPESRHRLPFGRDLPNLDRGGLIAVVDDARSALCRRPPLRLASETLDQCMPLAPSRRARCSTCDWTRVSALSTPPPIFPYAA